jgi:hypothetical protein
VPRSALDGSSNGGAAHSGGAGGEGVLGDPFVFGVAPSAATHFKKGITIRGHVVDGVLNTRKLPHELSRVRDVKRAPHSDLRRPPHHDQ